EPASPNLIRSLGRWDVALLTVGAVIGSGIFLVPDKVLIATQMSPSLAAAVWLAGAILSLCGAITYAELARRRPEAGGLYVYIRDGHGRVAAFVFGWMSLFVNNAGTVAALAAVAASLLRPRLPTWIPTAWMACALTIGLGVVNLLPARRAGNIQGLTAIAKFSGILFFAILLIAGAILKPHHVSQSTPAVTPFHANITIALVAVLWAFEGWQYTTCAAGEVREAGRSVAFGLIAGVGGLAIVFLLTSLGVSLWLNQAELGSSVNVVEDALRKAGFPALSTLVTIILPVAVLSAAHATLLTGSRVIYAMANDGLMPSLFARIRAQSGIPVFAVGACGLAATILAALGTFDTLLAYVIVTSWLFYGLAGMAIFRIPAMEQRNRVLPRIAAVVFCAGSVGVMLSGLFDGPQSGRYGLATAALGWIAGLAWFRWKDSVRGVVAPCDGERRDRRKLPGSIS